MQHSFYLKLFIFYTGVTMVTDFNWKFGEQDIYYVPTPQCGETVQRFWRFLGVIEHH